ncbi:MAG: hypothetical protein JWQ40_1324 [Segetibacter sp.]|nr:hypothetical protein [Segetibacter sp.]
MELTLSKYSIHPCVGSNDGACSTKAGIKKNRNLVSRFRVIN